MLVVLRCEAETSRSNGNLSGAEVKAGVKGKLLENKKNRQ